MKKNYCTPTLTVFKVAPRENVLNTSAVNMTIGSESTDISDISSNGIIDLGGDAWDLGDDNSLDFE